MIDFIGNRISEKFQANLIPFFNEKGLHHIDLEPTEKKKLVSELRPKMDTLNYLKIKISNTFSKKDSQGSKHH